MKKKIELLAPAGSYESLVAAVNAGADAIYIGGSKFGARKSAESVSTDEDIILKGIDYAHHFGVKVYLTVNILLKEKEIKELYSYILPYYKNGIDALIVQDLGVLYLLNKMFPDIEKHASTQMSIQGFEAIDILRKYGITRIVPARELSLKEIKEIYEKTNIEIECFVHGALCYAYSGQCLMSSLIGARSGNRGSCAQPCRLEYGLYDNNKKLNKRNETNLLSCKDLSSLDILPDIIEAGVYSLKIEGRMKSAIYTGGVVSIWRKYVDLYLKEGRNNYSVAAKDKRLLLDLFDRGGHTTGYYNKHNGKDMIAIEGKPKNRIVNEKFNTYLFNKYVNTIKKIKLNARIFLFVDKDIKIEVSTIDKINNQNIIVELSGDRVVTAINRAISIDEIKKQILKTGNTLYEFNSIDIKMPQNVFISIKSLNELRRNALNKIDDKILSFYRRNDMLINSCESLVNNDIDDKNKDNIINKNLHIICEELCQLDTCIEFLKTQINDIKANNFNVEISYHSNIMNPANWKEYNSNIKKLGFKVNLYMPHIFRTHARNYFYKYENELKAAGFDALVIRNLEELAYAKAVFIDKGIKYIFDYNIYGMNISAQKLFKALGANRQVLPLELNLKELKSLYLKDKELIIYGYLNMMVTASCLRKNIISCDKKSGILFLKDRMNKNMPVKNICDFCYNTILNSVPLSTLSIADEIKKLDVNTIRLAFTIENEQNVKKILSSYISCFIYNKDIKEALKDFTKGHFTRGIE